MKSFTSAAVLGLAAAASAAPSKRQDQCIVDTVTNADKDQVAASINQWFQDVVAVNGFLNGVANGLPDPATLQSLAQAALVNAQDEPCQLMTLISTSLGSDPTDAFNCAGSDLMDVFRPHVLDNLDTIIANSSDTEAVQNAVDDINIFRCCNVLSDATILWLDNAANNALVGTVQTLAPTEDACANIGCDQACTGFDNGSFGTVTQA